MKKKRFITVVLALMAANSFAQTAFDYLAASLVNVLAVSNQVPLTNFDYKEDGALWGIYLNSGRTGSRSFQLDANVEYLMIASSHRSDYDIDLKVYQGRGTDGPVAAKDTKKDGGPVVRFTPAASGWYTFELINSSDSAAFASIFILRHRQNANFTLDSFSEALRQMLNLSEYFYAATPLDTVIPPDKWALFGGSVRQGDFTGYYNEDLREDRYLLFGAGENSVSDCDIEVLEQYARDNPEGRTVSQNTGSEYVFDYGVFVSRISKYYNLRIRNKSSRNGSAFMFGFLTGVTDR